MDSHGLVVRVAGSNAAKARVRVTVASHVGKSALTGALSQVTLQCQDYCKFELRTVRAEHAGESPSSAALQGLATSGLPPVSQEIR